LGAIGICRLFHSVAESFQQQIENARRHLINKLPGSADLYRGFGKNYWEHIPKPFFARQVFGINTVNLPDYNLLLSVCATAQRESVANNTINGKDS